MGQTHIAVRTGAKSKSVLLSEQLTQINNYQTEGLLVHIGVFSLWHLLYWASTAARTAPAPDLDGAAVVPSSPGWRGARSAAGKPHCRRSQALAPLAGQGRWGCWSIQSCVLRDLLEWSPWKELGNLKAFTVLLGRCDQQNKLSCKRGHLDKFVLFPSNFWKVLYTCATVDFLNAKYRLSVSYRHMKNV